MTLANATPTSSMRLEKPHSLSYQEDTFTSVPSETRVSVEHRGFDRVPADSVARHGFPDQVLLMRLAEYWQAHLAALKDLA